MKNLIRLAVALFVVISVAACTSEQMESDAASMNIYVLSVDGGNYEVETLEADKFSEFVNKSIKSRSGGGVQSATGNVHDDGYLATFNAISNNGGVHGKTSLCCDDFWVDVKFNSECLYVIENKAFWGGTITAWEVNDGGFFDFIDPEEGWQLFWSAIDNGQGNNADPDLIGDALIIVPPPSFGFTPEEFGFESWCHFADADYNGEGPAGPDHTHGYVERGITNVQVK